MILYGEMILFDEMISYFVWYAIYLLIDARARVCIRCGISMLVYNRENKKMSQTSPLPPNPFQRHDSKNGEKYLRHHTKPCSTYTQV